MLKQLVLTDLDIREEGGSYEHRTPFRHSQDTQLHMHGADVTKLVRNHRSAAN